MDNQPSINLEFLIPILIGGFSVIGIVVVLLIGRSLNSPAEIAVTSSATPFEYVYLGTEPVITTPLVEESGVATLDEFPIDSFPTDIAPTIVELTRPSVSTPIILVTVTPSRAVLRTGTPSRLPSATFTSSTAAAANTYDDTDTRLAYSGNWVSQTGVSGAYQETLHRSDTTGDSVTFAFTGQEVHLFYQAGPSLGSVTITIDNVGPPPLSQAQSTTEIKEWVYYLETSGSHTVVVEHTSGGSVNIDYLFVPAPTPTPTRTPTSTTATP